MTVEINDNTRRVQFDPNGEALDFTDMINMQKLEQSRLFSVLLAGNVNNTLGNPLSPGDATPPESSCDYNSGDVFSDDVVIAPWPGCAYVRGTGVARQLTVTAGVFVTQLDSTIFAGTGEEFACARTNGGVFLTTAVGDATNPRIDLLEVKLEYVDGATETRHFEDAVTRAPSSQTPSKRRSVQVTYQIKQGTPAANPSYPAPSAGFIAMAAVYVPATHNTTHSPDNIRDLRVPMGIRAIDVFPKDFFYTGPNPWSLSGFIAAAQASSLADTDRVVVPCPIASRSARLLGVGVHGNPAGGDPRFALVRMDYPSSGAAPTITELADLSPASATTPVFGAAGFTWCDAMEIADEIAAGVAYKGVRAAGVHIGTPLWCNGKPGGMAHNGVAPQSGAEATSSKLAISFGDESGGKVAFVRFFVAEGLG